ncbi:hypothetical protein ACIRS1_04170 [Kitasatospora sp. NPDC101176]|uniref:hypothetical protein n=1 Tax=Kitasatospora sp. NPDC101176 TaxID=3364099 RepID=UPI0037FEF7F6
MTLRPLDPVPGDDDAAAEAVSVPVPAGLPAETRQALEFAVRAAAEAVMAGRVRVTEAPAGSDTAELAFDVRRSAVPDVLTEHPRPPSRPAAQPSPESPDPSEPPEQAGPGRAERRAALVARIRAANAETLERLKDL